MSRPLLGIYADDAADAAQTQASSNLATVAQLQTEVLRLDQLLLGKETTISGTNPVSLSEVLPLPAAASALLALSDEVTLRASTTYVNEQIATSATTTDVTALASRVTTTEVDLHTRATTVDLTALTTRASSAEGALPTKASNIVAGALDVRLQVTESALPLRATTEVVTAIDQRLATAEAAVALAATATDLSNTQAVTAGNLALLATKASINSVLDLDLRVTDNEGAVTDAQAAAIALTTRVTDAETSLTGKQNVLNQPSDVPGLTALELKQPTLTGTGGVPGLDAALSSKQATLSGTADAPTLDAALATK